MQYLELIEAGFAQAKKITRKHAKTFYFASPFLNREKRRAAFSIYSVCKVTDDYVDVEDINTAEQKLSLMQLNIENAYSGKKTDDPLLAAFCKSTQSYSIPEQYFKDLLDGMYMDLNKKRYSDFAQLYDYCYKVAGVVGLIMLQIFEINSQEAKPYAIDLGIAFQLTNILKDIKEDYDRGRIYLPQQEMQEFNVTEQDIADKNLNPNFRELLKFQAQRARLYYARCLPGLNLIKDRSCRALVLAMKRMYEETLGVIEKKGYDVFSGRVDVSNIRKIAIVSGLFLKKI